MSTINASNNLPLSFLMDEMPQVPVRFSTTFAENRSIERDIQSGDWLTLQQLAEVAPHGSVITSSITSRWKEEPAIFTIFHQGVEYFPVYALDTCYRPWPALKTILEAFGKNVRGWELSYWFDSPNSFLGWKRPKEVLNTDPDNVLLAAQEAHGVVMEGWQHPRLT